MTAQATGRIDSERFYDTYGRPLGRVDGDRTYDGSGRPIGQAEGMRRRQINLFFFFYM
jgi:YD repeat-containing protein